MEMTFEEWADSYPQHRPSIFEHPPNGNVLHFSDHFLNIMRPIFFKAYWCVEPNGVGYRHPNFRSSVQIVYDGNDDYNVIVANPPDQYDNLRGRDDVKSIIWDLEDFVNYAVNSEDLPTGYTSLPKEFERFSKLCHEIATRTHDLPSFRVYAYFVTLNPLIYTDAEWYHFVSRSCYIWNIHRTAFESQIKLVNVPRLEFPDSVSSNNTGQWDPYYNCYNSEAEQRAMGIFPNPDPLMVCPREKMVRYFGNLRRHYYPDTTEIQMIREIRGRFPSFVACLFEEMVRKFCICTRTANIPHVIFDNAIKGYDNPRSLISQINDPPSIIDPENRFFHGAQIDFN